jgi:PAT family beta-lactamase induction signal transducer AmpG
MRTSNSQSFRLTMFGLLYFVQGSALAYFRNFQKPYLDNLNIDADVIGLLTSILLFPFILKIFIGMLSDRVNLFRLGHRKPYMILGLILACLAFGSASYVLPDKSFSLFAVLIVCGSFSVALFDSTSDGLAIDITPMDQQGRVQGTMVSGRAIGFILLSLVFGSMAQSEGYRVVFLTIALIMLIPLIWVVRAREPEMLEEEHRFQWAAFKYLKSSRFLLFGAFAIFYSIVSFGVDGLVTYFMSDVFDASETMIGQYGALRGVGAVIGAVVSGILLDRISRKKSAYMAVIMISIGAVLIGIAPGIGTLLILGVVWGFAWGFQETVFVSLAMELSEARIAASTFAIMMALSNLGTAVGEGLATSLTDNIGFSPVFWALAAFNITSLLAIWLLFKKAPDLDLVRQKFNKSQVLPPGSDRLQESM